MIRSTATRLWFALALAALVLMQGAQAKIDLVTLPERASTQLTIYNDVDLTLVRESRVLTFREGVNQIQFSWANTLIDPTSLDLLFTTGGGNFTIRDITYPAGTQDTVVWNVEAKVATSAEIEILYFTSGVRWEADFVGMANLDETAMRVENFIRVTNNSGEDFENAQVRVVVGTINLTEKIAVLARKYHRANFNYDPTNGTVSAGDLWRTRDGDGDADGYWDRSQVAGATVRLYFAQSALKDAVKQVLKEGLSEIQLYTIEGTEELKNGWSRRLRAFAKDGVKIEVAYEQDERKWGPNVTRLYRSRNDVENKLGAAPLPGGVWRIFREIEGGGARWVGSFEHKYVPVGEKIELNLGDDGECTIESLQMSMKRDGIVFSRENMPQRMRISNTVDGIAGYNETRTWRVSARNGSPREVALKLVRYFDGDWTLEPRGDSRKMKQERRDDASYVFETKVGGQQKIDIDYDVMTRKGTNAKR